MQVASLHEGSVLRSLNSTTSAAAVSNESNFAERRHVPAKLATHAAQQLLLTSNIRGSDSVTLQQMRLQAAWLKNQILP